MEAPKNIAAGALGTRLAGRLTADLILRSPQYMSCLGEYQIDLRGGAPNQLLGCIEREFLCPLTAQSVKAWAYLPGNKLSAIENLGATENQFDSIDFSDNNVLILEGFTKLPRLHTLYLNNNRIIRIGRNLEESIPRLSTLILTNNRIKNLQDINPLATLPELTLLSLIGNEIALKPQYRLYVIHRLRHLECLDFKKVKPKEREEADRVFGEARADAADAAESAAATAADRTFEPGEGLPEAAGVRTDDATRAEADAEPSAAAASKAGPTPEQITAIKAAIQNAQTLAEVAELEKALVSGNVPSQFQEATANGDAAADGAGQTANGAEAASDGPTAMEEA